MPRRFKAPQHTSGVFTPGSGEIRAGEDGILELPDDASEADFEALRRAGCTPEGQSSPSAPVITIESYCDAYMAGEGREDPAMLQFAVNNGPEIKAEFARRAKSAPSAQSEPESAANEPAKPKK